MSKLKKKAPTNMKELRFEFFDIFNDLRNGDLEVNKANALANVGNVIIKSLAVDVEYMKLTRVVKNIDELDNDYKELKQPKQTNLSIAEASAAK